MSLQLFRYGVSNILVKDHYWAWSKCFANISLNTLVDEIIVPKARSTDEELQIDINFVNTYMFTAHGEIAT